MDSSPTPATSPVRPGPTAPPPIAPRSAAAAAVLGWVLPGLGQIYAGRFLKGLLLMATICGLFYAGLALTGFTCVNPFTYELEFVAHAMIGGPTAAAYWMNRGLVLEDPLPYFEIGLLYTAVAGLLNVVAICDALGEVLEHNGRARARMHERSLFYEALEAEAARSAPAPALAPDATDLSDLAEGGDAATAPEVPAP